MRLILMIERDKFKSLFLNKIPMLDVRAPCEFVQGAFPNTTNIPLLSDDEREQIGICYKQKGQDKAIELGHKIVSGDVKKQRVKAWKDYCCAYPNAYLYCFRGGMRSHLVQQWLQQEGVDIPLIIGGYKALRSYLLGVLEQPLNLLRISGQTGVGKTDLLVTLNNAIDLEGIANHRGSAFGANISKQPTQINFDNNLAVKILNLNTSKPIIVEDESRYIGAVNLPLHFVESMKKSPVIILKCSYKNRVQRIYSEYVVKQQKAFVDTFTNEGEEYFSNFLIHALTKIHKRLGGKKYSQLLSIMNVALANNSEKLHKQWISELLKSYYDPMYDYQITKKSDKIVYTGSLTSVSQFILNS